MTNTTRTRKLVLIAMLAAISFILMIFPQFPLIPAADFLKVEFSIIPILVGLYLFDLPAAFLILILRSVLKLLLNNEGINTWIGLPLNIVAVGSFLLIFAIFFKKDSGTRAYVTGSVLATLVMTAAMVVANFVYAIPLYAKFAHFDINKIFGASKYLMAMVVPFNLLEGAIFSVSFAIIFVAIKSILENMSKKIKVSH
ncbi:MAG: ECF transporter S component [Pseudolactococcus laudensis]|uniref:Riboflavin transporter n=1 Tax=Pseudolactococcus laudensis TaxID=1494461 RepID=A0A7V8SK04_9LACT|nr:ECF transporter S component [Lactococcus laudensis]MBA0016888.1 ECF transporter S component [Lactococcus laudensis]MBW9281634.1 ECF transporter S component [Lactococcus laudensis]